MFDELDFLSSLNLIFTACVACNNQVLNIQKIKFVQFDFSNTIFQKGRVKILRTKLRMHLQKQFQLNLSNIPTNYQVLHSNKHLFDGIKKCCGRTLFIRILQKLESK